MTGMEGVQVLSLALGYVMGQAIHAAARLNVADAMADGNRSVDDIARRTGAHAPSLRRLLRTLAGGGIVSEHGDGAYTLTTLGHTLRAGTEGSVRDAVLWVSAPMHYGCCGDLADSVKTGAPVFDKLFGAAYFDHLAADPQAGRVWDAGMACFSAMEDAPIASAYVFANDALVVDVGGGQGGFLAEVLRANPKTRGLLFDRAAVVANPQRLAGAEFAGRYAVAAGDFFAAIPSGGDFYVYKRILHDWDDERCIALLRRCREVIATGGRLLVIDAVIPPGNDPHPAKIVDMVMMGVLPGRERTEAEFATLFGAAGFQLVRVIPTHSMLAIIEGKPV